MLGSIVNCIAVLIGGCIGLLFKKGIPEKLGQSVITGLALCVMYIGIKGALAGEHILVVIVSVVTGVVIGEALHLDDRINRLGQFLEDKFCRQDQQSRLAQGFVTASLLFCVGAMAIVGSLQSGLTGNHETLFTKSLLDGIAAIVFASSFGAGVLLSGALVLLYEGSITLLAQFISPYLSTPVVNEMTCAGSLLIIALSLNMLKITNIKVMNYVPAVFIPILLHLLHVF